MNKKHTPGPWKIGIQTHAGLYIEGPYHTIICTVNNGNGRVDTELGYKVNPNARLIAAAPETKEELIGLTELLGKIAVDALQGNFELVKEFARDNKVIFVNGEPRLYSAAIAKSEA